MRAPGAEGGVAASLLPAAEGPSVSGTDADTSLVESAGLQRPADPFSESIQPRGSNHRQSVELGALDAAQQALEPLQHSECFTRTCVGGAAAGEQGTLQEAFEINAGWLDEYVF